MKKAIPEEKQRVLIFNPLRRLTGMFHSMHAAASAFKTTAANIYAACTGSSISCCGVYMRVQKDDIEIEDSDYGELKLEDYDQLCGVERKYYPNAQMSRKGMKYNTKNSKTKKK